MLAEGVRVEVMLRVTLWVGEALEHWEGVAVLHSVPVILGEMLGDWEGVAVLHSVAVTLAVAQAEAQAEGD